MTKWKERKGYQNSRLIMVSYGSNQFFSQWITGPFGFYVFFFYEAMVGLPVILSGLALIIYSLWNAVNDPLIGYLMERIQMPWEKRWGKRFPWVVLGAIPWLFSYLAIFLLPPELYSTESIALQNQWIIFSWFLISLCVYDTLFTLWNVNAVALYPDKFPSVAERKTTTVFGTLIGMMGIVAGSIVPPMFIDNEVAATFPFAATVSVFIGIILFFFIIPGVYENPKMREKYQEHRRAAELQEKEPFFRSVKRAISDRRFMVKVIYFFGYQGAVALLSASANYMITFVLREEAGALSLLMAFMLLGAFASVPLWGKFAHIVNNNKKMSLYAGWAMFITFLPIFFVNHLIFYMIALFLFGIGLGGQWYMDPPTMGDVMDDLAVRTGKREAAMYYGYNAFFIRLSGTFQAVVFVIIHLLTGFPEGVSTYSELVLRSSTFELALIGIRMHAALIPALLVLIAMFIFWKWYDITPEVVEENKLKLREMGL